MPTPWTEASDGKETKQVPGLRILIAEDDADCANSLAMLVRLYGHDAELAGNGFTAIDKARVSQPDVLLLDLGLPGANGFEVAEHLQNQRWEKKPFIIAVTGYGKDEDRQNSARAGIDLHLVKPVNPEQLCAVLSRFQQVITGGGFR